METLHLRVEVEPVPASRPRISRFGGISYSKSYTHYRKTVGELIDNAMQGVDCAEFPLEGPLAVELHFLCRKPKKPSKPYPRGDIDNYTKSILDALENHAPIFTNDAQFIRMTATKSYTEGQPCTIIKITKAQAL